MDLTCLESTLDPYESEDATNYWKEEKVLPNGQEIHFLYIEIPKRKGKIHQLINQHKITKAIIETGIVVGMMLPYIHLNLTSNKQEEVYCQENFYTFKTLLEDLHHRLADPCTSKNESDDTRKDEDFAQNLKLETCTEDINEIIGNQKALETLKERYI